MRKTKELLTGMLAGSCLMFLCLVAQAQDISAANISRYLSDGRWDWTVFIQAPPEVLREIQCVEYKLHPSFPNPVRKVCRTSDPRYPFGLNANGWGAFEIGITVTLRNGKIRYLNHKLALSTPTVSSALPLKIANTAQQERPGWWNWTVFVEGPENALAQIRCVEYALHPTFPNPVRSVCERGGGPHAFPLSSSGWGTFQIRIRVILRDGSVQTMKHDLKF